MDVLGDFLEDRCIVHEEASAPFNDLWKAYRSWCTDTDERGETKKQFGLSLTERGFVAHKGSRGVRIRRGLRLREESDPDDEPQGGAYATPETPCKAEENTEGVAYGGTENAMSAREIAPREVISNIEPHAPHAPHEAEQRIRKLEDQGMHPDIAREQVLGKGRVPE
jgi:hypothetical protein